MLLLMLMERRVERLHDSLNNENVTKPMRYETKRGEMYNAIITYTCMHRRSTVENDFYRDGPGMLPSKVTERKYRAGDKFTKLTSHYGLTGGLESC